MWIGRGERARTRAAREVKELETETEKENGISAWIAARCTEDLDAISGSMDLYRDYAEWTKREGLRIRLTQIVWSYRMEKRYQRIRRANGAHFRQIRLKTEAEYVASLPPGDVI